MQKIFYALALSFFVSTTHAETLAGLVVGISDGDTITLLDSQNIQHKVRLIGIDAPEKKQAFGNSSKKSLSDLIYSKQVLIEWSKTDRYGRYVAKVLLSDKDIGLEQIKLGMAWFYFKYQNELNQEDRISYFQAYENSVKTKIGLWSDTNTIAPWDC